MDELLDALTPLARLVARLPADFAALAVERLATVLGASGSHRSADEGGTGDVSPSGAHVQALLKELFGADATQARAALSAALSPAASSPTRPEAPASLLRAQPEDSARLRLAQVDVLARQLRTERADQPRLVLTVPDFLRPVWRDLLAVESGMLAPRQTLPALLDLAADAQNTLLLAAPYVSVEQAGVLAAQVTRLTAAGGRALVITRLGGRDSDNREALKVLQSAARKPGRLDIWAWEGHTLGVHFKVVIADGEAAYLGSANLTTLGVHGHAEAGVLLRGALAAQLESWLRLVASTDTAPPSASVPRSPSPGP